MENIDEEKFNKKFEEDLKEIKEKLHAEKPSDEFKQNLQAILEEELNKPIDKKDKVLQFPKLAKNLVAACACLILFFSGCFTFADDIENVIFKIFGSTDKIVEEAIANGNYKKIDMEYVEDNGVSIKVDYVAIEEDNLYIIFDILSKDEYDEIYVKELMIKNENDFLLYSDNNGIQDITIMSKEENITPNNSSIALKLTNNELKLRKISKLNIECNKILMLKNGEQINRIGNWIINIDI